MRLSSLFLLLAAPVYSDGQVWPEERNEGLELWRDVRVKSFKSHRNHGLENIARDARKLKVKNMSLGG